MKRYYIIYEGIVQGVGFRWKLMNIANRHNLTGYVRNLDNGNVEVEVQGSDVDQFIKESLSNDRFVKIYDYSIKEITPVKHETTFDVKYY
ncbi:MAG: acylphosphatase [Erysipelotrichaceae bacterium]|nr:acylphosphatase [Erysipelotrichaceae bacterium]